MKITRALVKKIRKLPAQEQVQFQQSLPPEEEAKFMELDFSMNMTEEEIKIILDDFRERTLLPLLGVTA